MPHALSGQCLLEIVMPNTEIKMSQYHTVRKPFRHSGGF